MRNPDILAVVGAACIVVGLLFAWWPLAILAAGVIMLTAAVLIAWVRSRVRRGPEDDAG